MPGSTSVVSENCHYLDFDRKSVTCSLSGPRQVANYAKKSITVTRLCFGWSRVDAKNRVNQTERNLSSLNWPRSMHTDTCLEEALHCSLPADSPTRCIKAGFRRKNKFQSPIRKEQT